MSDIKKNIEEYIEKLFQQTYELYLREREVSDDELDKIKNHISDWFIDMYEKDPSVLNEMSKSDDLLKMIKREFRFSKLLD